MKVVDVDVDRIKIEERAREDFGDIDELAQSISEKGLLQPIILDRELRLLAGHRRFLAHQKSGLKTIPAVIRTTSGKVDALEVELIENAHRKDLTWPERARLEKRIFDQKIKDDPTWSRQKQADLLEQAKSSTARRIQLAEAFELLPDLAEATTEDEAWKAFKKLEENFVADELARRVPAEVREASKWARDHYRIGDAIENMKSTKEGAVAHFAEVDPPYAVDLIGVRKARNKSKSGHSAYNEVEPDEYVPFLKTVATEVYRLLKPHSFAVFWYGMTWHWQVMDVLKSVGFSIPDIPAIWYKGPVGQTASPDTTWGSCYEPFFLARKGQPKMARPGRGNVFDYSPIPPTRKIHATEKPVELLEDILRTILMPGSAVLCPFLGSGVTLRAAYKLGHTGWGYDLDERNKELFLRAVQQDLLDDQPIMPGDEDDE